MGFSTATVRRSCLALGLAVGLGSLLGGCTTPGSNAKYQTMPAERVWTDIRQNAQTAGIGGKILGGSLGETWAEYADRQEFEANQQAANATTPREALEAMVDDVSYLLSRQLPEDARSRGLDGYRLNIAMGDFVNRDQDPALRGALSLIKRNLERDRDFNEQFGFLTFTQSTADELIGVATDNPQIWTDPSGEYGDGRSSDYNPASLYVVTGETWITRVPNRHELTVWTDVQATHVQTRRGAGGDTFSRTYVYHPGFARYIPKAMDDDLHRSWSAARSN